MQMSHVARISQRRYITRENALRAEEKYKLQVGGDGTVVETSMNPADSIMPIQDATISQDIYMLRQGLKKTIRETAGVSDSEMLSSTKFESATEPQLIEQAAQSLRGDQQATFESFVVRVVSKLAKICQQTMDSVDIPVTNEQMQDTDIKPYITNKLDKIVGENGATVLLPWLSMSKEDIEGDYVYDIEIGSTMPINDETRKRDAVALYQMFQENPYIRGREGTLKVLEAFNQMEPEKLLKTEEEVQQGQMAGMKAQIDAEIAKGQPKQQTDLTKTQMKTETTKQVAAMRAMGDAQKTAMDEKSHTLDMAKSIDEHNLSMRQKQDDHAQALQQAQDNHATLANGHMIDLASKAALSRIKVNEADQKAKINLQTALKAKNKDKKDAGI
jgi:DNA-directed RNA polymerase subunit F